jgi:hypothetical protein
MFQFFLHTHTYTMVSPLYSISLSIAQVTTTFEASGTGNLATRCSQSSDFRNFQVRFTKIFIFFMARDQLEVFIWTFVYLGLQNLLWDFLVREYEVHLKFTFSSHGMPPALMAISRLSQHQIEWFFHKNKKAILYNVILSLVVMVTFVSGLLLNLSKVPKFQFIGYDEISYCC